MVGPLFESGAHALSLLAVAADAFLCSSSVNASCFASAPIAPSTRIEPLEIGFFSSLEQLSMQ
jgi:hypothetical protein